LGQALATPSTGYSFVYHSEIILLFVTLAVLGPMVKRTGTSVRESSQSGKIGLADFPT
jgi:BCD family chlorophyll transporter-like MFS transporter